MCVQRTRKKNKEKTLYFHINFIEHFTKLFWNWWLHISRTYAWFFISMHVPPWDMPIFKAIDCIFFVFLSIEIFYACKMNILFFLSIDFMSTWMKKGSNEKSQLFSNKKKYSLTKIFRLLFCLRMFGVLFSLRHHHSKKISQVFVLNGQIPLITSFVFSHQRKHQTFFCHNIIGFYLFIYFFIVQCTVLYLKTFFPWVNNWSWEQNTYESYFLMPKNL